MHSDRLPRGLARRRDPSPVDKPATRQGPVGHVVTLAPTQVASAVLNTAHGTCTMSNRHDSSLVRVFAPGDTARLQTFLPLTLCGAPSTITALTAGAGGARPVRLRQHRARSVPAPAARRTWH